MNDAEFAVGVMLGQGYLLGLWAGLGGLRVIARWGIVITLCVAGTVAIVAAINRGQQEFIEVAPFAVLLGLLFMSGVAIVLLPLRSLAGWRVDFDRAYYAHLPLRRGQVGLLDYAGYTCAVAGPLVVIRLMLELADQDRARIGGIIAVLALLGGTAMIPSYLVLVWRWFWLAVGASAAWIIAASLAHSYLGLYFDSVSMGQGGWWGFIDVRVAAFHAGVGVVVLTTLGYLRRWGLKLLVVP